MIGRLGKLAPKPDRRTLRLEKYLPDDLPIPAAVDWSVGHERFYWGQLGNDQYGDCTCAAACHQTDTWRLATWREPVATTQDALTAYSAISGFDPTDPSTDRGAQMLDALKYWRNVGISGRKIEAFTQCTHGMLSHAIALFGGAYIGLALPKTAQDQEIWRPVSTKDGSDAPWSWGGHAVNVVAYDPTGVVLVTWGERKRATWDFVYEYCDEAYAEVSSVWAPPVASGPAPGGLDMDQLLVDLERVQR